MKVKIIPSIIVAAFSALVAYGMYHWCVSDQNLLVSIGYGAMSFIMLIAAFGIDFEPHRTSVNIKVASIVFFVLALISNLIFVFVNFKVPVYVVVNGILFLIWLMVIYGIGKAKQ